MNDLTVTVTGWVATDPTLHSLGENKGKVCGFRMGHTPRYRDGDGTWRDGETEWLSIRVFRSGCENVGESIHKGQPVVVHGRLRTNIWVTTDGAERRELQLDASVVGHDLTKGFARFTRQMESAQARGGDAGSSMEDAAGDPEDAEEAAAAAADEAVEDTVDEREAALA